MRSPSRDRATYIGHFRRRVVQDALAEASADDWSRRATTFENAMHKPGDFPGLCDVERIEANNRVLAAKALACRQRAAVIDQYGLEDEVRALIATEIGEVA